MSPRQKDKLILNLFGVNWITIELKIKEVKITVSECFNTYNASAKISWQAI